MSGSRAAMLAAVSGGQVPLLWQTLRAAVTSSAVTPRFGVSGGGVGGAGDGAVAVAASALVAGALGNVVAGGAAAFPDAEINAASLIAFEIAEIENSALESPQGAAARRGFGNAGALMDRRGADEGNRAGDGRASASARALEERGDSPADARSGAILALGGTAARDVALLRSARARANGEATAPPLGTGRDESLAGREATRPDCERVVGRSDAGRGHDASGSRPLRRLFIPPWMMRKARM